MINLYLPNVCSVWKKQTVCLPILFRAFWLFQCHKDLNDINAIKPWNESIYIPSCTGHTMTKCAESSNSRTYDFSKFTDVHLNDLVDLGKYLNWSQTNTLCKKYSLSIDPSILANLNKNKEQKSFKKYMNNTQIKESYCKMIIRFYSHYLVLCIYSRQDTIKLA